MTKEEWFKKAKSGFESNHKFHINCIEEEISFKFNKQVYSFLFKHISRMNPEYFSFLILEMFLLQKEQTNELLHEIKIRHMELERQIKNQNIYFQKTLVEKRIRGISQFNLTLFALNKNNLNHMDTIFEEESGPLKFFSKYIFFQIDVNNSISIIEQLLIEKFLIKQERKMIPLNSSEKLKSVRFDAFKFNYFQQMNNNQIFIISEFNENNDRVNKKIREVLEKKGWIITVMNIDIQIGNIDLAIKNNISSSRYIIANLSYEKQNFWNPNVMYELGLAKGMNKNIIMFLNEEQYFDNENNENLPFDINSHSCIKLESNDKEYNQLISKILSIIGGQFNCVE